MEVGHNNWWEERGKSEGGAQTPSQDITWPVGGLEGMLSRIRSGGDFVEDNELGYQVGLLQGSEAQERWNLRCIVHVISHTCTHTLNTCTCAHTDTHTHRRSNRSGCG